MFIDFTMFFASERLPSMRETRFLLLAYPQAFSFHQIGKFSGMVTFDSWVLHFNAMRINKFWAKFPLRGQFWHSLTQFG